MGSKITFIFGHFRANLRHLLLGNHGNPEQKVTIFWSTLTRTTQKCILSKFWEIYKIELVQPGTLYQKTGLKLLIKS